MLYVPVLLIEQFKQITVDPDFKVDVRRLVFT